MFPTDFYAVVLRVPEEYFIFNQLEKLEAAKAACLVYLSLLSLTGSFLALLGLTGPYWAILGLTRPYWALLGLTWPYWALLGHTGPFKCLFCICARINELTN